MAKAKPIREWHDHLRLNTRLPDASIITTSRVALGQASSGDGIEPKGHRRRVDFHPEVTRVGA